MSSSYLWISFFLITNLWMHPISSIAQQIVNVPQAFKTLNAEPEIIVINNKIKVPTRAGHLQGVQLIERDGVEQLLISGSSLRKAYLLQIDLATRETDQLISLMKKPYRHAGGIQVSERYLIVGIEDNFAKTSSKVCLYHKGVNLEKAHPTITIYREGEVKRQTAGATGLLALDTDYLVVVANWDSRNWDFYQIDPEQGKQKLLSSFAAPSDWGAYQAINLLKDEEAIYAIGFYKKEMVNYADLILVSKLGTFQLIMETVTSKAFNCKDGVDFSTAAGLQVDKEGKLHIWSTQRDARKQIVINRFSQN